MASSRTWRYERSVTSRPMAGRVSKQETEIKRRRLNPPTWITTEVGILAASVPVTASIISPSSSANAKQPPGRAVGVAEGHRQRVGLVFADGAHLGQEPADHERDLLLGGGPVADDRQLHLGRGVFVDGGAALARREQDDAADVADLERGERALPDEGGFHGDF